MTRIALLPWAALLLASPATAQVGVAPPSGFIVAATQGQVSVTGTTSVTNVAALRVPANSVGRNGHVEIKALITFTNSANNKVLGIRWGTTAGATSGLASDGSIPLSDTAINRCGGRGACGSTRDTPRLPGAGPDVDGKEPELLLSSAAGAVRQTR